MQRLNSASYARSAPFSPASPRRASSRCLGSGCWRWAPSRQRWPAARQARWAAASSARWSAPGFPRSERAATTAGFARATSWSAWRHGPRRTPSTSSANGRTVGARTSIGPRGGRRRSEERDRPSHERW